MKIGAPAGFSKKNLSKNAGRRPVFRVSHCIGDFIMSVVIIVIITKITPREPKIIVVLIGPESFGVKKLFNMLILMPRIQAARRNFEVMVRIYGAQ